MRNTKLILIFSVISFVAVLIVLNSIVFSVRTVTVYCYNADDESFNERVLEAAGIKHGQSIFFLNENEALAGIDGKVFDAKTVNIERKFPSRVQINVIKRIAHSYAKLGEDYIVLDPEGKVIEITDEEGLNLYYHEGQGESHKLIELKLTTADLSAQAGEYLSGGVAEEMTAYRALLRAFERVDYRSFDVIALLEYIDLTNVSLELITAETKAYGGVRGTQFLFFGTGGLDIKVENAVRVFLSADEYRTGHVIKASQNSTTVGARTD